MDRNKRLFRTTIIYFIGTFGSKLLVFLLMPLYAANLSTEQFGTVNLITNIAPLIGPIFTLQVTEIIFRFLCTAKDEYKKKEYITNSFLIFLIGIVSFIVVYIPVCYKMKFSYTYLFLLYFVFNYLGLYLQQILRGTQKNIDYSITGILSTIAQLTVNIILIKYIHEKSILIAIIIGSIIIISYSLIRLRFFKFIEIKLFNKSIIKEMIKYSLPLIPNQISWWLNGTAGLYILKSFCGVSATGLVSFANKFPSLIMTVNSIFLLAWTENSIYEFESSDREEYYSKNLVNFTKFIILFAAILLPIIKVYYKLFIVVEYHESMNLIPLMFVSMGFNAVSTFIGTIYTASMKTKGAFYTTIIAAVVNLIFATILIPIVGMYGYVVANVISYIVFYITRKISINKILKLKDNYIEYIVPFIIFIISAAVFYRLNIIINFICAIFQFIYIIYVYRSVIYKSLKKIKIKAEK